MNGKKIVFLGTPQISAFVLEGLVRTGFNVVSVVTKEDKVRSRGNKVEESDVAKTARILGIPCHKPHRINKEHDFLQKEKPDLLLTFAYGQILSEEVLGLGTLRPLNLHASLLPKYRGAAPIQYALRNGDTTTGVTLMEMVKAMDAGDIYAQESLEIDPEDDYTSLSNRLAALALDMAVKYLPLYFEGKLQGKKQEESEATFCPTIKKEEEKLSLMQSPEAFVNAVRSLSQEPGGHLLLDEEPIKIFKARKVSDEKLAPAGTVLLARKKEIHLQLSEGIVALLELQRPGKKRLSASDFNNGNPIEGKVLE